MTKLRKRLLIGVLAIGLGAGSAAAFADRPDCGPMGYGGHGKKAEWMKERMEKRAAELHDKLKLNASQESAWQAYLAKMKPADMPARPDRAEMEKLSAPQRMEKMHALMQEREKRMAERVAATKDFYAVLTPEQRKIFDEQFKPGQGRRHGPR